MVCSSPESAMDRNCGDSYSIYPNGSIIEMKARFASLHKVRKAAVVAFALQ